ncbi:MAG: hypothetical protein ABL986_04335 [Vicinamibacterales bacterium]
MTLLSKHGFAVGFVVVLLAGVALRVYHLDVEPAPNDTADEFAWTWSGMTLLSQGTPTAWSWLPVYGDVPVTEWRGNRYRLVTPYLDHPPLYSVFMGAWMRAWGSREILSVDLAVMRRSSVVLFTVLMGAMAWALRQHLSQSATLLALLLMATAPPAVLQQRLVISENLWTPLTLVAYALLATDARKPSRWSLAGLVFCAAALPLAKVAALASSFFLMVAALSRGSRRLVLAVGGGTVLGVLLYLVYGYAVGGDLFVEVLRSQSDRFRGLGGFYSLLFEPAVVTDAVHYMPFVLGVVASIALCLRSRPVEWALPVLCYAAAMAYFMNQGEVYGWYFLPLYPWLAAATADLCVRAWRLRRPHLLWVFSLFVSIGVLTTLQDLELADLQTVRYVFLACLLGGTGMLWMPVWGKRLVAPVSVLSLIALVATNVLGVLAR